jgi:hypothetical protein
MEFQRRYDERGRVAVLVSHGYGAGWSTWADAGEAEAKLFDSRIVDAVLAGQSVDEITSLAESLGYESYLGGADGLRVYWLEPGTRFTVEDYDGNESLRTFDDLCYVA